MTAAAAARIASPDNGYFEIWERPCGHQTRVHTEDTQWNRRTRPGYRAAEHRRMAAKLAAAACPDCPADR
jgi:hypothetical protein